MVENLSQDGYGVVVVVVGVGVCVLLLLLLLNGQLCTKNNHCQRGAYLSKKKSQFIWLKCVLDTSNEKVTSPLGNR